MSLRLWTAAGCAMFGMKLSWQVKFVLRALWLGGMMLVLGAYLFSTGRPTSDSRGVGLLLMLCSPLFGAVVFLVSWLRRRATMARQARAARKGAGSGGRARARPSAPARARRPAAGVR